MTQSWGEKPEAELTDQQTEETTEVLRTWARRMDPETPLLAFLDGSIATALDVAEAMDDPESELRQHFLHLIAVTLADRDQQLEQVLSSYRDTWR